MTGDYFARFPVELQWRIFEWALIVPYIRVHRKGAKVCSQGICIIDGKAEFPYDISLFMVNRRISALAKTVCYSKNRFILGGDCLKSLEWIQSRPRGLLHMIRRLDLLITPGQFLHQKSLQGWDELVASIPGHFDLENLWLSIDACRVYPQLESYALWQEVTWLERHAWMLHLYSELLDPFLEHRVELFELKDFFVFYPQYRSQESRLEKLVMGYRYDSIYRGKVDLIHRDWKLIHGWEWSLYNDNGRAYQDDDSDWYTDPMLDVEEEINPPSPDREYIRKVSLWNYKGHRDVKFGDALPTAIDDKPVEQ